MSEKSYWKVSDEYVCWVIVAADREHAITILRSMGDIFTDDTDENSYDVSIDKALSSGTTTIRQLTDAELATKHRRCHTEDERGVIPLVDAIIGDAFCSEW